MDLETESQLKKDLEELEEYKSSLVLSPSEKEEILVFANNIQDCGSYLNEKTSLFIENGGKVDNWEILIEELNSFETNRIEALLNKTEIYKKYASLTEEERREVKSLQSYLDGVNNLYNSIFKIVLSNPESFGANEINPESVSNFYEEIYPKIPKPLSETLMK